MKEIYYKIVTKDMRSVASFLMTKGMSVKYKLNEWTTPKVKGSKLFVFEAKKEALSFISKMKGVIEGKLKLYKCRVKEPIKCKKVYWLSSLDKVIPKSDIVKVLKRFWETDKGLTTPPPISTYEVDAIKLIKEVRSR